MAMSDAKPTLEPPTLRGVAFGTNDPVENRDRYGWWFLSDDAIRELSSCGAIEEDPSAGDGYYRWVKVRQEAL
jgi:hypothetical protein